MPDQSLAGRVIAVTGANGGIGSYTSLGLAKLGAHVVLVCRNRERADATAAWLQREAPGARTSVLLADLSRLRDVRELAATLRTQFPRLSVLVNNAGVIVSRRTLTSDGIELIFAVNHVAPFVLSTALLDMLVANAPARIVNVCSDSHFEATIDFDNLNAERRFFPSTAYGQSKLANMLFTKELSRRTDRSKLTVNALHPGLVNTGFGDVGGIVQFGWFFVKRFGVSPEEGARTPVYCASSPELEGTTGAYFRRCHPAKPNPLADDPDLAARLWTVTEDMIKAVGGV